MNYEESEQILKEVKNAEKILINCHRHPDVDSVASCLALGKTLTDMGKTVDMISPDPVPSEISFLNGYDEIEVKEFKDVDLGEFDLFVSPDSGSLNRIYQTKGPDIDREKIVVIDHHFTNTKYGKINLVDDKSSSTSEILFLVFEDWGLDIEKETAFNLLAGIIADSGGFQYDKTSSRTFELASQVLDLGVDLNKLVLRMFRSYNLDVLHLWAEILGNIKIDDKHNFAYSVVRYNELKEFEDYGDAKSLAANMFIRGIKGTDFGFIITEPAKNTVRISFRERNGFDVSKIAEELGGGGHKSAAGLSVDDVDFDEYVKKVLKVARKYANKDSNE